MSKNYEYMEIVDFEEDRVIQVQQMLTNGNYIVRIAPLYWDDEEEYFYNFMNSALDTLTKNDIELAIKTGHIVK